MECSPISGTRAVHEDDAERAIRSGLAIIDRISGPKSNLPLTFQARIGIASGVVVVGDLVREGVTQENAAIGETTNLAARLQSLADPQYNSHRARDASAGRASVRIPRSRLTDAKGFGESLQVRQSPTAQVAANNLSSVIAGPDAVARMANCGIATDSTL